MATPLIGIIVLCLAVAATVGGLLFKHFSWERSKPKNEYRGVRYELEPDCVQWTDMELAIDTLFEGLDQSRVKDIMSDLWIRVNAYGNPIKTSNVPSGYVGKNMMPAPAPKNEEEAQSIMILNGLTEFEKKWPIGRTTAMVYVRQHRPSDGKLDGRLLRGTGPIVDVAAKSALFHEIAEHVNPFRKGEGTNASHSRTDLIEVTKALTLACLAK